MADLPQPVWFVQLNGRAFGPVTLADLRRMARDSQLLPETPLSRDGTTWFPASSLPALRDEFVLLPTVPPPLPVGADNTASLRPVWIAGGIVTGIGGLLLFLVCLGVVLAAAGSGQPAAGTNPVAQPAPAVNPVAEATAGCWLTLRQEFNRLRQLKTPQDFAAVATRLESLPAVNVDTDLVQFVLSLAALLRESSLHAQRQSDPNLFFEAVMRGANGDPFGTYNDQLRDQKALLQRWAEMESYSARLRAVLSQRYGAEFPAI